MTEIEDVTIRPMQPKPSLFPEPAAPLPPNEPPAPRVLHSAGAGTSCRAPAAMPRIDELPMPGQNGTARQAR